mgnify:CR=1 FL=1
MFSKNHHKNDLDLKGCEINNTPKPALKREKIKNIHQREILYTLLGIVLLCFPKITTKTICYAIGIILILVGIGYVISYITKDFSNMYSRYELVI